MLYSNGSLVIWRVGTNSEVPVVEHQIRYDDGAGYERYMGSWSRLAGEVFLDWLAPRPGLRWIDIGCGLGGGFPLEPIQAEMRAMGLKPVLPPSPDASRMDTLRSLWTAAGLEAVETREITVQRTFADFDAFWTTCLLASSIRPMVAAMASGDVERLKTGVHERLPADAAGRITYSGRANAIKGRVPA